MTLDEQVRDTFALPPWASVAGELLSYEDRYEPIDELGQGGNSEVKLMRDLRIGREVAVKFLRPAGVSPEFACSRFIREVCVQGQLEHPSIVPVHDVGTTDRGEIYFTMKRIHGLTLMQIIRGLRKGDPSIQARFSQARLLTAFNSICLTVAFAHERGYIHRDIKPGNIMLGDFGETYLLDWGIATRDKEGEGDAVEVSISYNIPEFNTVGIMGTPAYMAPEQFTSKGKHTLATDIYSLGAILFELLTLEPLKARGGTAAIMKETFAGVDARCSARAPGRSVPPELEAICVRATALDPTERFGSVREMSNAIERFLDGHRDRTLRAEAAAAHAREALEEANTSRCCAIADESEHRSLAMRSVGKALALDPGNATAAQALLGLIKQPPRVLPKAVDERSREREDQSNLHVCRLGLIALAIGAPLLLPVGVALGVRDWNRLLLVIGTMLLAMLFATIGLMWKSNRHTIWYGVLASCLPCVATGQIFGSIFLMPMVLAIYTTVWSLVPSAQVRRLALFVASIGCLVPQVLELRGILPRSFEFDHDMLVIKPLALHLRPDWLGPILLIGSVLLVIAPAMISGHLRRSLKNAEDALLLQTWLLSQLLPHALELRSLPEEPAAGQAPLAERRRHRTTRSLAHLNGRRFLSTPDGGSAMRLNVAATAETWPRKRRRGSQQREAPPRAGSAEGTQLCAIRSG